ncbi:uncharacterized protein RHOBADRAFT_16252 [Rhodotorula graminis WP1]|uniref:Mitochondrial distribution and morphology protein 12 n=1 Tax=Rhodotorula graminis (strain WP1) TaxID=578459 RepID=A0A0P9GKJ9_RHOGW|nr:uncharacterized protein RHOBADRAFT_16252 [Rhodotorula graminis WP1]KPV73860.1 hypothetical protein RHOBADRAFT_16252 [Rhodotorula graminis WP1]
MSIDLEWSALDAHLTQACTRFLSHAFNTAPTPDFLGPLEVTAFSFGDAHPELTLVDIRDIQHDRSRSRSPAAAPGRGRPPLAGGGAHPLAQHDLHSQHTHTHPHSYAAPSPSPSLSSLPPLPPPSSAPSPSFQVHLRLSYSGNLSLGIATALRINYPSSSFMSLPLSLTLTGLALEGTLVVAFEGGRRRVHLSLLEPDPFSSTTPGARVLRAAHVESEVGQADKHVLRNVGKVEKFVVDVARKTLENELVFPCVLSLSLSLVRRVLVLATTRLVGVVGTSRRPHRRDGTDTSVVAPFHSNFQTIVF